MLKILRNTFYTNKKRFYNFPIFFEILNFKFYLNLIKLKEYKSKLEQFQVQYKQNEKKMETFDNMRLKYDKEMETLRNERSSLEDSISTLRNECETLKSSLNKEFETNDSLKMQLNRINKGTKQLEEVFYVLSDRFNICFFYKNL